MQEPGLVPNGELDFADFHSYYLSWYDGEYDKSNPYGEPVLSSQGVYDGSNFEETEDFNSRSTDQDFRGMGNAEIGSDNWFGQFESYFGEAYSDGQYQEQKDGISSSNNDDIEQDFSENQWFGYGDLGFEDNGDDSLYQQGSPEFEYRSSWDDWEETTLYEQIFGD
ncbi:hypothetical protein F511_06313 [Dorcoceras hygrometricum]|uniref:Uncharacterized protein n=1 Tax=Dorcoceras hygrometricum TaxID=472368 RepID=A0A2Z7AXN0_9LAMI|nr:hypothetical protein F511_06313 [Dorcoceras hygrometricum]